VKLNSLLLAVTFSFFGAFVWAQTNNLDFSFTDSRSVRDIESNLNYRMSPVKSSLLQIRSFSYNEQRLNFSQKSRRASLEMDFSLDRQKLRHNFHSGYLYLYDSSELEQNFQPYKNKTGFLGYSLDYSPLDSLLITAGAKGYTRSEEDRYTLGKKLQSDGYLIFGRASANAQLWGLRTGLGTDLEIKKLDWEYYNSASLNAYLDHQSESFGLTNRFNFNQREDDLFVLSSDEDNRGFYDLYDAQKRTSLNYNASLTYRPVEYLQITLNEDFSQRKIELEENLVRNNADYINQASLGINLSSWDKLGWDTTFSHGYAIKEFNFTQYTRHTQNRNLSTNLYWEYIFGDTLSAGIYVDLQRTSFPDDEHRWDNDLRNVRFKLGNVHYWRDRLKLSNRIFWNVRDDVYVHGILSSNNKQTNSIIYNPECAVLIGERMLFNQSYVIRADYTDYVYDTAQEALYRQLAVEYNLVFDSFPFIARSTDQRWMLLPYRNKGESAFLTDLSFGYERNEYADYNGWVYSINFKNTRYTAKLTLKHDIQDIYYIIQPQYSWGTWQEYEMLVGFAWKFTDISLLEFSLNPQGEYIDDLDWHTTVSLSAKF
jgi:hypothetical protein